MGESLVASRKNHDIKMDSTLGGWIRTLRNHHVGRIWITVFLGSIGSTILWYNRIKLSRKNGDHVLIEQGIGRIYIAYILFHWIASLYHWEQPHNTSLTLPTLVDFRRASFPRIAMDKTSNEQILCARHSILREWCSFSLHSHKTPMAGRFQVGFPFDW